MFHNQNFKKMMRKLKTVILLVAVFFFATSCHDYFEGTSPEVDLEQSKKGKKSVTVSEDDDSDRPDWAGGNTSENPHIKGNDQSGTTRGGDYGDLYQLLRDGNGVPTMRQIGVEWYVQPVGIDGNTLDLDSEGELVDPTLALEVDFGRLNIVRAPQSVLDQALREALKVIDNGEGFTLDFCGRLTIWNTVDGVLAITKTIDSPRENMAMYQEIMNNGFSVELGALEDSGIDPTTLAASCFAAGSDKTGTVDIDEVVYINGFMNALGCDPITNANEYEFNSTTPKKYFNFENCECNHVFEYSRTIYKDRELNFYNFIDGVPTLWKTMTIWDAMDEYGGGFTGVWSNPVSPVDAFAKAVDDAVQVLDFVHGNSNIEFVAVAPE